MSKTVSTGLTIHLDVNGRQLEPWESEPCWCGRDHSEDGPWGIYPWGQHHCMHHEPLAWLTIGTLICTLCGQLFRVDG